MAVSQRRAAALATACLVIATLLAVAAAQNGTRGSGKYVEINTSIITVGPGDYTLTGNSSRCIEMVNRAATNLTGSRLMFVPTLFWVGQSQNASSFNAPTNVTWYCYNRTYPASNLPPSTCKEATQAEIDTFKTSMQACFAAAVAQGKDIALSPHMDDGLGLGAWRNSLIFDPYVKYSQWSYNDFMLFPLADALSAAVGNNTKVYFGMQGEMSATVWRFPGSYIRLLSDLRQRILLGKPASYASNVKIGVSTNFNKLCGCVLLDLIDPTQYLNLFGDAIQPVLDRNEFNLQNLTALYNQTDFIGISSYPSLTPNFTIDQLESATFQFDKEASYFGINLTDLTINKGKPLYWNEYGVGGGASQDGLTPARNASQAAATPFFGVFTVYNASLDPWQEFQPESESVDTRNYLRYFYNQTMAYLTNNRTFNYKVSGVYLWNQASWDFQAIYPSSTSSNGSYYDRVLVPAINAHNAIAIAQTTNSTGATAVAG